MERSEMERMDNELKYFPKYVVNGIEALLEDNENNEKATRRTMPPIASNVNNKFPVRKLLKENVNSISVTIRSSDTRSTSSNCAGFQPIIPSSTGIRNNKKKGETTQEMICDFCKSKGNDYFTFTNHYLTHYLYYPGTKIVACPVLKRHICEICGENGRFVHTAQFCPMANSKNGRESEWKRKPQKENFLKKGKYVSQLETKYINKKNFSL